MALCGVLALTAQDAWAQPKSDWERQQEVLEWREQDVELPTYPAPDRLVEFYVSPTTTFRFFVDAASLAVGDDGVVRYAMVARSPSGSENVSYEGIRCRNAHYKVYAIGRPDQTWSARPSDWRPIEDRSMNRQHQALQREYLCKDFLPVGSVADGIDALRRSTMR